MKTDTIFYELFKEFPDIFFELIGKPDTNPSIYEFKSSEIKQSSFRLDGIFSTSENFTNEPIYFVEVQSYKDIKTKNFMTGSLPAYCCTFINIHLATQTGML